MNAGLTLALAGALLQQGATISEQRLEYNRVKALLREAESRDEGRRAFHALVERMLADPATGADLLYNRAKDLAADCSLTPDPLQRARWYAVAATAAERTPYPEAPLAMEAERARLLAGLGALEEAELRLEAALARYPAARKRRPSTLVVLADLQRRLGRFDAALDGARQVEFASYGDPAADDARDAALLVRSAIARDVGSPEQVAAELTDRARERGEELARGEDRAAMASALRVELLRIAIAQGDHESVRDDAQALLADPVLCRSDAERAQVLLHLGASRLELERGARDSGAVAGGGARACFEAVLRLEPEPADAFFARTRLGTIALERGDLAECRAELAALRAIAPDAVPLTTRVEGAVIEAQLALAASAPPDELGARRTDLERAWDDLARAWRSAPRDARGIAFLKYSHRRAVLSQLALLDLALEPGEAGVARAFDRLLAAQELSTLASARPGERATLATLRRDVLTGPRHGLLVYLPARDRSHAFAVDRGAITHHLLARSAQLEELRREHVEWLLLDGVRRASAAERAEIVRDEREAAAALSAALLPDDVRVRVREWDRWSIGGTDTLGLVAFEWLPFDGERFLGASRAIDVVPSLPHAARAAAAGVAAADVDLVLVADARPSAAVESGWPGLGRVELGTETRAELAALYAPERMRILDAGRANAAEVEAAGLARVAVLQFVVHAVEERGAAVPVALALTPDPRAAGDDGLFRADAIARLGGAPALVILTACGSGAGPARRGDPLIGSATGAWFARGARTVVVSHHALSVGEARRTTRVRHAALCAGATPAEALRDVRRDLAEDEPELAPFLHALQQVVGLGHVAPFAGERAGPARAGAVERGRGGLAAGPWMLALAGLSALALGIALRARRRRA